MWCSGFHYFVFQLGLGVLAFQYSVIRFGLWGLHDILPNLHVGIFQESQGQKKPFFNIILAWSAGLVYFIKSALSYHLSIDSLCNILGKVKGPFLFLMSPTIQGCFGRGLCT